MAYIKPHIGQLDTTTQSIAVAGTPQVVTFDTTILAVKIVKTSTSRFTFNEGGNYVIIFDPTIACSAAGKTLDMWVRINGTDVANSNTKMTIVSANDQKRPSIAIPLTITAAQYVEIWMNGDSTLLQLIASAAGVTPTRPVSPSIFMTIDRLTNS